MPDLIKSTKPDKSNHEMAQSTVEFEHFIRYLTVENQTILDPFMGNGNSIIAGLKLNRRCIGIEIDKKRFDDGVNKIKESLNEMKNGDPIKND
jgi:DNA modification methylase